MAALPGFPTSSWGATMDNKSMAGEIHGNSSKRCRMTPGTGNSPTKRTRVVEVDPDAGRGASADSHGRDVLSCGRLKQTSMHQHGSINMGGGPRDPSGDLRNDHDDSRVRGAKASISGPHRETGSISSARYVSRIVGTWRMCSPRSFLSTRYAAGNFLPELTTGDILLVPDNNTCPTKCPNPPGNDWV